MCRLGAPRCLGAGGNYWRYVYSAAVALMLVCGVNKPPDKDYVYSAAVVLVLVCEVNKPPDKDYVCVLCC